MPHDKRTVLSERRDRAQLAQEAPLPAPTRQLELWSRFLAEIPKDSTAYAEFWDSLPMFISGSRTSTSKRLDPVIRHKTHQGQEIAIEIRPIIVSQNGSNRKEILQGTREEMLYHALRNLATENTEFNYDPERPVAVSFSVTLSRLRRSLADLGHDIKIAHIREGLEVLSSTAIIATNKQTGDRLFARPMLAIDYIAPINDPEGKRTIARITFAEPIAKAIFSGNYHIVPHRKHLSLKTSLARWFFLTFSFTLKGATPGQGYMIHLSRILRESPFTGAARLRDSHRHVLATLEHLAESNVLAWFTTPPGVEVEWRSNSYGYRCIYSQKGRGRPTMTDVHYWFGLSDEFVASIRRDNALSKQRSEPQTRFKGIKA